MLKKRCVKIVSVLLIIVALIALNTSAFGAINESYYDSIKDDLNVVEGALDSKIKGSILLDAVAILVYAVGSLMEWILGLMFRGISGSNMFPWADAILFNAVPLLDINVFNPSGQSLVGIMQEFIASSYWTIFSLALSFLGIAIMVTAIKLVISTIASDKALYKQAIMKWLMGFIMLWGIHFFMSFVLYLNEALVETASTIAQEATEGSSIDLYKLRESAQSDKDIIDAFVKTMSSNQWTISEILIAAGVVTLVIVGVVIAVHTVPAVAAIISAAGAKLTALGTGATAFAKAGVIFKTIGEVGVAIKTVAGVAVVSTVATVAGTTATIELPPSELTEAQQVLIESVRSEYVKMFENSDAEFIKALQDMGLKISGSNVTIEFLSNKEVASVAARLLRNNDYVNFLQTEAGRRLLADADEWTWNSGNGKKYIYELAADSLLVLTDTYTLIDEATGTEEKMSYKDLINGYQNVIAAIEKERNCCQKSG